MLDEQIDYIAYCTYYKYCYFYVIYLFIKRGSQIEFGYGISRYLLTSYLKKRVANTVTNNKI